MSVDLEVIHPRKYKKKCAWCGNEFVGWNKNQKYCGEECKHKNELKMGEIYRERARLKAEEENAAQKKKEELNRLSALAKKAGTSYGKYVAINGL